MNRPSTIELPQGLASGRVKKFTDLIADITGKRPSAHPYLAPALLFAEPGLQAHCGFPVASENEILVHDYQGIEFNGDFPLDSALRASLETPPVSTSVVFGIETACGASCARVSTGLRVVPRQDLSAIRATRFRNIDALCDLGVSGPLTISQTQVDRYQALSGDDNPIHSDTAVALSLGLPRPIVPGLLLVSAIQPLCEQALPKVSPLGLKIRFLAPLCVQNTFHIAVQSRGVAADGNLRARVSVYAEDARALAIADLRVTQH